MNRLTNLTLAILALILVCAVSCSKDDDADKVDPIVGTWENILSFEGFSMTTTMTFKADHSGTSKIVMVIAGETESESVNFTYSTNGSALTLTEGEESTVLTYSISGNKLTLTEDGEEIVFTRK
ncbi:lipocalin family protein [Maribellus mangrovi]|uniref:lipocalin family protein n=1 Tax=Maribellus mangrovi TaxID=3133146 RepID=UPI0030EE72E3